MTPAQCAGNIHPQSRRTLFTIHYTPGGFQKRRSTAAEHRRSQDFFRGWVRPGADPGFLVGDDGGAEGPERGAVGAKRRSAEGVESGKIFEI